IAKISGIVVVQQIIMPRIAIGIDRLFQRSEVVENWPHTRSVWIKAIAVGAAAKNRAAESSATVTVFRVPVVRGRRGIGIFDFVHGALVGRALKDDFVVGRRGWVSVGVAKPDGVGKAEHDAVRAGAAHHGLVIVVAHGVMVRQKLHIWRVALQNVI